MFLVLYSHDHAARSAAGSIPGGGTNVVVATVTTVIATYNYARYLAESIASVLDQTWRDIELIVVDDASTDGTEMVVRQFVADPRFQFLRQPTRTGPAVAFNRGLSLAGGQYVAVLGADDAWLPDKLARQVQSLTDNPRAALNYTNATIIDAHGNATGHHFPDRCHRWGPRAGWVLADLAMWNFIPASSVLFRRHILDEVGLHDESLLVCEDWDLWLRIAARHEFSYLDESLVRYRLHGSNAHRNATPMVRDLFRVLDRVPWAAVSTQKPAVDVRGRAYAACNLSAATLWYDAAEYRRALHHLARALSYDWRVVTPAEVRLAVKSALQILGLRPARFSRSPVGD
jgi:glycosyltransferase involved in cell wall biosynthesis